MGERWIWIDNPCTDPHWNLAAEEYLLTARAEPTAMLWRNGRSVIIGRNQDLRSEVDMEFAARHGIVVSRRLTGGGAVFHDLGNVNYTFIASNEGEKKLDFSRFAAPLIAALGRMGVVATLSGRNDLLVEGRKVSGCAHTCLRDRALHHGTLLFSADLSAMTRVLRVREEKYQGKGIASVASRVGNLAEWLSTPERAMDVEGFMAALRAELLADGQFTPYAFSEDDIARINMLREEKFAREAWIDGGWRAAKLRGRSRCAGGTVEAWLLLKEGRIEKARLTGDFFGISPVEEVEAALTGLPYDRESVARALPDALLRRALWNVPRETLLESLFFEEAYTDGEPVTPGG